MVAIEVVQLLVSPGHRYEGRPAEGPSAESPGELVTRAEVRGGLGIVGDRYFARPAHRDAALTLMAAERLPLDIDPAVDLRQTRRNVLLRGVDIDAYVGATVSLDCGTGPVLLAVRRAARPCAWMDAEIGPGAQRALRGGGGVRCTPLSDGVLTVGPAVFEVVAEAGAGAAGAGGAVRGPGPRR
ncbi:molybdenum cofactor biosysynthesis protein [Kitasatospora camelliae]|uniref:Molybdenum cofactor biosysynthesis protein n=1 Tax=Kitasatospora camelliae TaxID=3156397 RepID=A0AAU8K5R0_9ACTN